MSETTWKQYGHPNEGIVATWETHPSGADHEPGTVMGLIFQGVRPPPAVFVLVVQVRDYPDLYCQSHATLQAAQDDFEHAKLVIEEQIRDGVIEVQPA